MAPPTRVPRRPLSDEDAAVQLIAEVLARALGTPPPGDVWIGDDAAVVSVPGGRFVFATDAVVAGVHADLSLTGLDDLGWKALTATVSDVGAVGGRPSHAVVDFCVAPGTDLELLAKGTAEAAAEWRCPIVGGDLTAAPEIVVVAAVVGLLEGDGPPVLRSGASPGDALFVTGPLGASAAGLRLLRAGAGDPASAVTAHKRPRARIEEGVVARRAGATAMMDVSDGLALDLGRLAEASAVGVRLDTLPVAEGATEEEVLAGGEDFELVIATPAPARLADAFSSAGLRLPIEIGRCTGDRTERTLRGGPLGSGGFRHHLGWRRGEPASERRARPG
ncbi:MAG: thiamine-phosphate kinase [Actinomycetota bacterium]|nr:thiamine-phosphate kinase [Actinomycetota bacterium]